MTLTVHQVRLSQISISPTLACVPMRRAIIEKFSAAAKPELKKVALDIAAEHAAQLQSLDEDGILDAIKCYREGRLWIACDGRHRIEWAYGKKLIKVPITEVTKEAGLRMIESSVIGRIHWTKGQRAWLGVMQHPEVCDATNATRSDPVGANTATGLASRLGVSADVVTQAVQLYRLFFAPGSKAGSPEAIEAAACKAKYEHLIWGGAGLGGVLAGIAGGDATKDKPKAPTGFHHLDAPLASLSRLGKVWMTWTPEERAKGQALIVARIRGSEESAGWPDEFRQAIAEAIVAAD